MDYIVSHLCNMQIMLWFIGSYTVSFFWWSDSHISFLHLVLLQGLVIDLNNKVLSQLIMTYQVFFDIIVGTCFFFTLLLFTIRFHIVRS
jgi:hypothetical protein